MDKGKSAKRTKKPGKLKDLPAKGKRAGAVKDLPAKGKRAGAVKGGFVHQYRESDFEF